MRGQATGPQSEGLGFSCEPRGARRFRKFSPAPCLLFCHPNPDSGLRGRKCSPLPPPHACQTGPAPWGSWSRCEQPWLQVAVPCIQAGSSLPW